MDEKTVLETFRKSGALIEGHFKLSSGKHSDIYYEKFNILKQPHICDPVCTALANLFADDKIELVVGPTTGGVIIAYVVARRLGINAIYAEPDEKSSRGRVFKRGFNVEPGTRILIVDDVMTTGGSIFEVIDLLKKYDAHIVGVGELLDRSGGKVELDYPFKALATVTADAWEPDLCPLCKKNIPITQRGSRKFMPKE